jgi:hypothetical protein
MEQRNYAYPIGTGGHLSVPLSNLAVEAFSTDESQFIAPQVMPTVPVDKQTDRYYTIESNEFLRVSGTGDIRAPKALARRVEFTVSCDSYFANNYALAAENALEDIVNADAAIRLSENSVRMVVTALRRNWEVRVANLVTSISNVGSGVVLAGAAKWGDPSSDPIADIRTGQAFMMSRVGVPPNVMIIDWNTLTVVKRHPALIDLYKYVEGGELTDANLASAFGVQKVLVGTGYKNVSVEGSANSIVPIWGNSVVLAHVGQATGMQSMTFGLSFRWRNPIYPGDFGVKRNVEDKAGEGNVEIVEAGYYQDEKIVARDLAYAITSTL